MNFADNILNGLFNEVQHPQNAWNVQELLERFGLNWTVEKEGLLLPDQTETDFFGVVRQDNRNCFTTCKQSFTPYQNAELAELLIRLSSKTGYSIYNGGMFNGGGKVYLQLESPNKITGLGENRDTVNGYLTGLNGHDGTTSLKWGETNITISCRNTFMYARRELKNTVRHTESIHKQVEIAISELSQVVEEEKSLFDTFIRLADMPADAKAIATIVAQTTGVDVNKNRSDLKKQMSGYALNRADELLSAISKEMHQKGATMWGLLSGVTQYTSHVMPTPKRENGRLESLYTGTGYKINNQAFASVLELAGV